MSDKFEILTLGVVYDSQNRFLVTKRSKNDEYLPGTYAYVLGDIAFDESERFSILENHLIEEFKEDTDIEIANIDYIKSFSFEQENKDKVAAIAFLAEYKSGEATVRDTEEIEEVVWMSIEEIRELDTLPVVLEIYESAYTKLEQRHRLHHLAVAGLIINDKGEYLLVEESNFSEDSEAKPMYTFPWGEAINFIGSSWEMLEKNLVSVVEAQTNIKIKDGSIPFTDQSFLTMDGFDEVIHFFICRYDSQTESEEKKNIKWVKFEDFDKEEIRPTVYNVFSKASTFLNQLSES